MTYPPAPPWEGPGNPFQRWLATALAVGQLVGSVPMLLMAVLSGVTMTSGPGAGIVASLGLWLFGGIVSIIVTMSAAF
jgi:hypothetical protein